MQPDHPADIPGVKETALNDPFGTAFAFFGRLKQKNHGPFEFIGPC
jgi:hypothetical protein